MEPHQELGLTQLEIVAANVRLDAAEELKRPSTIFRPCLRIDGDKWCALYGDNLQDGVAGFGDSPAEAMAAFDEAWSTKLEEAQGDSER